MPSQASTLTIVRVQESQDKRKICDARNREIPSKIMRLDSTMVDTSAEPPSQEKDPLSFSEPVRNFAPIKCLAPPRSLPSTKAEAFEPAVPGKRGPKKKIRPFEPDENRPSVTIKEFLDDFVGGMSPSYSPPASPDASDPLARTRDASVQTDSPPEVVEPEPSKTNKKGLEKLKELNLIDVGNEVDVPLVANKSSDRREVWSEMRREMSLEKALMDVFNSCKAGEDNALSSISDPSTVPEPSIVGSADHKFSTHNTVNVIRSAAQFCEFNHTKIQLLEELVQKDERDFSELEETMVKNLSAVMCITGVEFIRKCFDRVLKDAINRGKSNDKDPLQVYESKRIISKVLPESHPLVQYSEETKQMSKALLAYSGRAFQLLKQIADLPAPFLVRTWSTYSNGDPGFSDKAFRMLQQNQRSNAHLTLCSLSVVDVPLKKDVHWDGQRLFGYEDLGFGRVGNDCVREATKAVVFYVKSLVRNRRIPVGYCLADNLTPSVRANLIMQYLAHLDSVGLRCVALVCDYSAESYETFVELGAFLDEPDSGWFFHPAGRAVRVMCFTDINQNLKALKNLWVEKKIFRPSPKAEMAIDIDHIAMGEAFLKSPSMYTSIPTIGKLLSELKQMKSQALDIPSANKYNAVMLTILRDIRIKTFAFTADTIKYLENLTAVTDIFSSAHPFDCTDRRPLNSGTTAKIQNRLTALSNYFGSLCFGNGAKILQSDRKLPVALMKMNICSLKNVTKRVFYGERHKKYDFYTKTLSLDDVNMCMEAICGGKRLVTPFEFKTRFKNFMDDFSWTPSDRLRCDRDEAPDQDICLGFNNIFLYEYSPLESASESALEFLTENVVETWLENVKCLECSQVVQKGILTFREYNLQGNVVRDIHKMIRTAETCLAQYAEIPCDSYDAWFSRWANRTMNSLTSVSGFRSCNHLFVSAGFGEVSHFTVLVKDMLRIYLKLRLCFLTREERIKIQAPREHSMKFSLGRSWT